MIGSMVLCGLLATPQQVRRLKQLGVKDSKQLSPHARTGLREEMLKYVTRMEYIELEASLLGDPRHNITTLELRAMVDLILHLKPQRVFLDVPAPPGKGVERYCLAVRTLLDDSTVEVIGENRADERYPLVSAASIFAKLRRDELLETLKTEHGDFGSGYPSDPKTKIYLQHMLTREGEQVPPWVRLKWAPVQRLLNPSQAALFSH